MYPSPTKKYGKAAQDQIEKPTKESSKDKKNFLTGHTKHKLPHLENIILLVALQPTFDEHSIATELTMDTLKS